MLTRFSFTLAAATAFAATAAAQVPYGYIVTAESNTAPDGFRLIDPATGNVTEIVEPDGNFLGGAQTVALDASTTNSIIASAGFGFGTPVFQIPLEGNYYDAFALVGQSLSLFGKLERMHATPNEILFTLSTVSDGLYTMSSITGFPTQLSNLSKATDIAVINGFAYINSYESGMPSTIVEVDLATQAVRTVGTGYATIRSLGTLTGTTLIAGREDGTLDTIDVATGIASQFLPTGLGMITAIVEDDLGLTYFSTDANEIYSMTNIATPVYSSPHQLNDFDFGRVDQATQVIYGEGCAATSTPMAAPTAGPALGSNYTVSMTGGVPSWIGGVVLGFQRQSLDLSLIGLPGCTLLADNFLIEAVSTDVNGDASLTFPIPGNPALTGQNVNAQFFVFEAVGQFSLSQGIEGHMR